MVGLRRSGHGLTVNTTLMGSNPLVGINYFHFLGNTKFGKGVGNGVF